MSTNIRENIHRLLSTEMDRTEILKVYGIAILTAIGVSGLLKALAGAQPKQHTKTAPQSGVYGGRNFGE